MKEKHIEFANWIGYNGYEYSGNGEWYSNHDGGTFTTDTLYGQFEFYYNSKNPGLCSSTYPESEED